MKRITIENVNQLYPGDIIWNFYGGYFTILKSYYNANNEQCGYCCIESHDNHKRVLYFDHLTMDIWYRV